MGWTAPRTWAAGETVTAALLNTHLRDNLKALGDPMAAYTPSWTSTGTAPTIGNGTIDGLFAEAGKFVTWSVSIVGGSTTGWGTGTYSITLPRVARTRFIVFSGVIWDASAPASYPLFGEVNVSTRGAVVLRTLPTTAGNQFRDVTATVPITLATSDALVLSGTYEAA